MQTQFIIGEPSQDGIYLAAVRTAEDMEHFITVQLTFRKDTPEKWWVSTSSVPYGTIQPYRLPDQVVAYAEVPQFNPQCFDNEQLMERELKAKVCRSKRPVLTVSHKDGDPTAYTIMKPFSSEYEGQFIVLMEDAWGNVDGDTCTLEELQENISMEDLAMIEEYFKRKGVSNEQAALSSGK